MKKNLNIAVIGLGYVGLPLAVEFAKKFKVIGFDSDDDRISQIEKGIDKTNELSKNNLLKSKILYTSDISLIKDCNVYIVTVPTPVDKNKKPDMQKIKNACETIGRNLKKDDIVIFESTVYPGATEEFCIPILEDQSNLKYNIDFFCGYSPERINPGDKNHGLTKIKKITSGSNVETADFVDWLYSEIITAGTHKVSSIIIAEASKVIENIQRDVNIALINEFAMIFDRLKINSKEVLEAANTKWNFLPFNPGLVGGHCIGVDPYYLAHKAHEISYFPEMILAGRRINEGMSKFLADKSINLITKSKINLAEAKITVMGITFKENCPDFRNTKIVDTINILKSYGCEIRVTDPWASKEEVKKYFNIDLIDFEKLPKSDLVIIAVAHDSFKVISVDKWKSLLNSNGIIIDVKSILEKKLFLNNFNYWSL